MVYCLSVDHTIYGVIPMTMDYMPIRKNSTKEHTSVLNLLLFFTGVLLGCFLVKNIGNPKRCAGRPICRDGCRGDFRAPQHFLSRRTGGQRKASGAFVSICFSSMRCGPDSTTVWCRGCFFRDRICFSRLIRRISRCHQIGLAFDISSASCASLWLFAGGVGGFPQSPLGRRQPPQGGRLPDPAPDTIGSVLATFLECTLGS